MRWLSCLLVGVLSVGAGSPTSAFLATDDLQERASNSA